jgi:cellobiose phosphorylase
MQVWTGEKFVADRHGFMEFCGGFAIYLWRAGAYDGLVVDPCIPHDWDGFKVTRQSRGKSFDISVKNSDRVCKGVAALTVNGRKLSGTLTPHEAMQENNIVEVILG